MYVAASCPWDLGCGTPGVARPPAWQTFFHAPKNMFQNFFDRMNSISHPWQDFGKKFSGGSQAQGQWSHKAMTCACGMYVHCTVLHTCPLALLAHANFAPPCQRESQIIPNFEIKECSIVKMHSCGSKEAKMRSRNAISDSKQQNSIFKYH